MSQSVVFHVSSVSGESGGIQLVGLPEEHKPWRFTCAHGNASCQAEKRLRWQALGLSLGLFSSYSCMFIMYLFLLQHNSPFIFNFIVFTIQNYSAEMDCP